MLLLVHVFLRVHAVPSLSRASKSRPDMRDARHSRRARPFDTDLRQLYHPRAMGQRPARRTFRFLTRIALLALIVFVVFLGQGCDRPATPSATSTTQTTTTTTNTATSTSASSKAATVASLSPAATEILIGIGAGDRLVAVSNYDPKRPETKSLPRVGDYQTTDWEQLAALRPRVMITQFAIDRLPGGLVEKADALKIRLINVPITRLDDIYAAMRTLGKAVDQPELGASSADELKQRMAALRKRNSGRKVRALIVVNDNGREVAGRDNYLNDALEAAGGENVIRGGPYPQIDKEILFGHDPEVIFQLLPEASPQVQAKAQELWKSMPNLQAVRNGRVHVFTETWVLRPSHHIGDLAERFAAALNEVRSATPATTTQGSPSSAPVASSSRQP
jgi:ABC-type Fe3+-hydroxamate transport system substrate-binding protein